MQQIVFHPHKTATMAVFESSRLSEFQIIEIQNANISVNIKHAATTKC